jgi:hypothetical protein
MIIAVAEIRGQFGNPEEHSPLEAITRGQVKTQLTDRAEVCAVVSCSLLRSTNGCW